VTRENTKIYHSFVSLILIEAPAFESDFADGLNNMSGEWQNEAQSAKFRSHIQTFHLADGGPEGL
jgi:hypothetical protein